MMGTDADVIVVGAGAAGLTAALPSPRTAYRSRYCERAAAEITRKGRKADRHETRASLLGENSLRPLFLYTRNNARGIFLIQRSAVAIEKELPVSSSAHPDFPPEMRALFCEVLDHLNRASVPYVVAGAFALQQHTGIWRNTKDLDLFLPAPVVPEALRHLAGGGLRN